MAEQDIENKIQRNTFKKDGMTTEITFEEGSVSEIVKNEDGELIKSNVFYSMGSGEIYRALLKQHGTEID